MMYLLYAGALQVAFTMPIGSGPMPSWPAQFQSTFWSPSKRTSGLYALGRDTAGKAAGLLTFADGTRDHLCSAYHNNTACSMLEAQGWRYMVFPQIEQCCKCCSFENGCGPLSPHWLNNATGNLIYMGVSTVSLSDLSYQCHKWHVIGLDPDPKKSNYYYEHMGSVLNNGSVAAGRPCEIDGYNYLHDPSERSDDQYIFNVSTFETTVNPSIFAVPTFCQDTYCRGTVCDDVGEALLI
eukprot:gnl/MRDRNA2_/MRDRNA2_35603_c0_seq1.p1 gnl/MRDRNA2_/MRDRNA2_35603_c0~~gnl/MRDRNA2_/MRDRNA2_35603_c0_seq1.p1  ORF type:complete len:238 (+),score=26.81 gnl/MRDRNA2_/MRDRNA2_35603_c0_seq1:84-797(+)